MVTGESRSEVNRSLLFVVFCGKWEMGWEGAKIVSAGEVVQGNLVRKV